MSTFNETFSQVVLTLQTAGHPVWINPDCPEDLKRAYLDMILDCPECHEALQKGFLKRNFCIETG